jgi:glucokinase
MGDNNNKKYWAGFDLGGTKMLAALFDAKFNLVARNRKKTKGANGAEETIARLIATLEEAMDEAKIEREALGAIGAACPGPLHLDKGIVLEAPNLGWHDVPIKEILEKKFKCPTTIVNDVDAGTYGEYRFGAAQKGRCVVGIFPGTGIGGGCVYEDKLLRGRTGSCMEIGHMLVQPNGRLCGCGQRGCLETVASRLAIAADCAMAAYRGDAPNLLKIAGTDLSNIRSGALADAIKAGDKAVEKIVRAAAAHIGFAAANVTNLLAPDLIVLGGGLVEALQDILVEEVHKAVEKRAMSSFAKSVDVVAAKLGDDATIMGAAALAAEAAQGDKPR